jgi:serine/threonine protein kinase
MANVYLAVVEGRGGFSKLIVLKVMRASLARDPNLVTLFMEEGRLASRLSHPNVVQTHEVGEDDGHFYLAMEYLDGQSQRQGIDLQVASGPLDFDPATGDIQGDIDVFCVGKDREGRATFGRSGRWFSASKQELVGTYTPCK